MIKRLASCIKQYKKNSILTPLFVSCEVIIEVIIPWIMAKLIDNGIDKGDMTYITQTGIYLAILCVESLIFGALAGKHAAIASSGYAKNLRSEMYQNIQKFSFSNIDKFSSASIVTRLTTDVTNVQNAYQMIIRIAVRSPLMLIFSLVMAFRVNAKLSLIFLAAVPVLGIGLFLIMTKAHPIFEKVFAMYDKLNNVVQENLRGIRVVKSFVCEDHENEKFSKTSKNIYNDFVRAEKILSYNMPLMQLCSYGCLIFISWFGARFIVNSQGTSMTTGNLMSLITYAMQILISLMMLSMVFVMIIISRASAERIVELLDEKSDIVNPEKPEYKVKNGSIVFKDVNFSYSKNKPELFIMA